MSGNLPHLLVPITLEQIKQLVHDEKVGFEEKIDGERLMADRQVDVVMTSNKLGVINTASNAIVDAVLGLPVTDILLDGESLNHEFYVFDILRLNGECLKSKGSLERWGILSKLFEHNKSTILHLVQIHVGVEAKQAFLNTCFKQ